MDNKKLILKYAFLSSCLSGLIAYLYFMANNLDNYDNVANKPFGFGVGLPLGRWFLSVIGNIVEKIWFFNSSYFNCILAVIILSFSNVLLVYILEIKNKLTCILICAVTMVFPSIAATMLFSFTVQYYMFAVLLGMAGIYFIKKISITKHISVKILLFMLSGCFYACSLGIYQAYYPLLAAVLILCLVNDCLNVNINWKDILKKAFYYLASLVAGYIIYNFILKICLIVFNRELSDYRGVSEMGVINPFQLPGLLYKTYSSYIMLFKDDFISINPNLLVKIVIFLIYVYILITLLFLCKKCNILKFIELCVFILLLPLASNAIIIMVPNAGIGTMMSMGTISVFYLPLIFFDKTDKNKDSKLKYRCRQVFSIFMSLVVLNYIWVSNINYNALYYANKKVENYFERLYCRIESIENYNENMPVIFIGDNITDAAFLENWSGIGYYSENVLAYGQLNEYSRDHFILNYLGRAYSEITEEQYSKYKNEIEQMAKYPNDNSIRITDGNILVKLE